MLVTFDDFIESELFESLLERFPFVWKSISIYIDRRESVAFKTSDQFVKLLACKFLLPSVPGATFA